MQYEIFREKVKQWVDFHYEVNGKMYDFSIPGGGFVSLEHVVEVLGIAGSGENEASDSNVTEVDVAEAIDLNEVTVSEATKKFVADVASVEFSKPSLVDVSKVEETTTVGAIKESRDLEVEYSVDLSEEQIAEINNSTVEAGDWALISMQPFTSEESLTVRMVNGDVWTIRITDAQVDSLSGLQDGHSYVIFVNSTQSGTQKYYVLKNDGSSVEVQASQLSSLGSEYLWTYHNPDMYNDGGVNWTNGELVYKFIDVYNEQIVNTRGVYNAWMCSIKMVARTDGKGGFTFKDLNEDLSLGWNSTDGFQQVSNSTGARIKIWDPGTVTEEIKITYTQNNINYGTVSFTPSGGSKTYTSANTLSIEHPTNNNKQSENSFTANPASGYHFVKWEVSGSGKVTSWGNSSSTTEESQTIKPTVTGSVTITAVFEKDEDITSEPVDYSANANALINRLKQELKADPTDFTKTAKVVDESKRMFQVDFSASSHRKVLASGMTLSFITDVSRSMYFPANLTTKTATLNSDNNDNTAFGLITWLNKQTVDTTKQVYSNKNVYYILGDKDNTATMLAVFYDGSDWKVADASYFDDLYNGRTLNSGRVSKLLNDGLSKDSNGVYWLQPNGDYKDNKQNNGTSYKLDDLISGKLNIYTASAATDDDGNTLFTRMDYLKKAMGIISRVVYEVDPEAKIGLVTFAGGSTPNHKVDSQTFITAQYTESQKDQLLRAVENMALYGGTRQDFGLNEAYESGWYQASYASQFPEIAILITDGAPNISYYDNNNKKIQVSSTTAWNNYIKPQADNLKSKGVELYTLGVSLEKVGENKKYLYNIAGESSDTPGSWDGNYWSGIDQKYQNNAENGEAIVESLMDILRSMEINGNLLGTVTDTVDKAFYPVDANGKALTAGVYKADGTRIGSISEYLNEDGTPKSKSGSPIYSADNNIPYYTWEEVDGEWKITWYNQEIKGVQTNNQPGWTKNFLVKAKEDFLGGNTINTNSKKAEIAADRFTTDSYPSIGTFEETVTADVSTPSVNVKELALTQNSTEWTVYLDTTIDPESQLKKLFDTIDVQEVVTKSDSDHKIATDGSHCAPGSTSETFKLSEKIQLSIGDWADLISGEEVWVTYNDYEHNNVGRVKVVLTNEGSNTSVTANEHQATPVGNAVEKYKLEVTYIPTSADTDVDYKTTPAGSPGNVTGQMNSVNQHTVNVYALPLDVLKVDDSQAIVPGATFDLYRAAEEGEEGTALTDYDASLKNTNGYVCISTATSGSDGLAHLAPVSDGATDATVLVPRKTYYLIETSAPSGYSRDTVTKIVTVQTTDGLYTNLSGSAITSKTYPINWNQGASILVNGSVAVIVNAATGDTVTLKDANNQARTYVLKSDPVVFRTTIINVKAVDLSIKKEDDSGNGLAGAVFQLKVVKSGTDVLVETDPTKSDYLGIGGIGEVTVEVNGQSKTYKSAIKTTGNIQNLTGFKDGTYKLVEVIVPAGYVITIPEIEFTVANGVVTSTTATSSDKVTLTPASGSTLALLTIQNEPGAALPSTGGPGTTLLTLLGSILVMLSGVGLILWRRLSGLYSEYR